MANLIPVIPIPVLLVVGLNIEKSTQDYVKNLMHAALMKNKISVLIEIVADPTNPFDPNAIKVLINNTQIGFISKNDQYCFDFVSNTKYLAYIVSWGVLKDDSVYLYIQPFLQEIQEVKNG